MKRLCTICARGGSKGAPNKNIRDLGGKPLLAHTIEQAQKSHLFEAIALSSDSQEILAVAKKWNVDILITRPAELASDVAAKITAIRHCLEEAEKISGVRFDIIVDLDVTSPFRTIEDIRNAVELLEDKNASNVITGAPARKSPYFNLVELDEKGIVKLSKQATYPVVRRQDAPKCFDMNASIYAWQRDSLFKKEGIFLDKTLLFEMPVERSIEIDSELDFKIAHFFWR